MLTCTLTAGVHVRWNQAGYHPDQPKVIIVLSDEPLSGQSWTVQKRLAGDLRSEDNRAPLPSGTFGEPLPASPDHVPTAHHYRIDLSSLGPGEYDLMVPGASADSALRVDAGVYRDLVQLPLRHLRVMRSGSQDVLLRQYSHDGDKRAPVMVPKGDPAKGQWSPHPDGLTVDASGGWYDAGDQIKFTLNIAYTTYHLLVAYQLMPELFGVVHSRSGLPDILDEALHGLEYLARAHPTADLFVVQVGNAEDHNQEPRLPEHDKLDGKRPALCALSRVHLASTAAALSLGSRVFREHGLKAQASRYADVAQRCLESCLRADALETAFERDQVNDFYRDTSASDQIALAAAELYQLRGDERHLGLARRAAPPAAGEVSWAEWNWLANRRLARWDDAAGNRLRAEARGYVIRAQTTGSPWGLPSRYVWGSLHRWVGAANAARLAQREVGDVTGAEDLYFGILDYVFGRNNWGVSFLFAEQLPNTLRHLYSPAYELLNAFPTGAFSEGPGNRKTHESLQRYFQTPPDHPYHRFNTRAAVFFDHNRDFMCQEATIGGQADVMVMLTLACLPREKQSAVR